MTELADSTQSVLGTGIGFGYFCDAGLILDGLGPSFVDFPDTDGVAISSSSDGQDNSIPLTSCGTITSTHSQKNVVREPKSPVLGNGITYGPGQIDIVIDAWPFIQLYDLNPTGNVVVQYNKGGGVQSTTLTFDTVDQYAELELDRSVFPQNSQVHVTVTDVWLNIDPTDEDSWTFGTLASNPSTNYQVFDENGVSVGDIPENTDANLLTSTLDGLMCQDNCIFLVDPNVQGSPLLVLTLQDNEDTQIVGIDATSFQTSGENLDGDIPLTLVELGPNVGVFGTYDEGDVSILKTTDAARGTSGTVDYNETPTTVFVGFGFATTDMQLLDDEWNSGEEIPVILIDSDLNKNSRADEDLDLFNPDVELIPSLTIGNPFTLNSLNPLNGAQLSSSSLTVDDVQRFSERTMLLLLLMFHFKMVILWF